MMGRQKEGDEKKDRQFNMRMTDDLWAKLEQLAVDLSVANKRVTLKSEVLRILIEEEWKRRSRRHGQ
jgi:hypothetical protein